MTVTARETFPYAGITRTAGEEFEATLEDARILSYLQRIEPIAIPDPEPTPRRRIYRRVTTE